MGLARAAFIALKLTVVNAIKTDKEQNFIMDNPLPFESVISGKKHGNSRDKQKNT
jgi:hypothetical protein